MSLLQHEVKKLYKKAKLIYFQSLFLHQSQLQTNYQIYYKQTNHFINNSYTSYSITLNFLAPASKLNASLEYSLISMGIS